MSVTFYLREATWVRWVFVTAVGFILCLLPLVVQPNLAGAQERDLIIGLAGRWAGKGTMVPASGPREIFRCVVTYFPSKDGSRVRQNLRCHSESFKFDAATHLQIDGARVTGRWLEKIYSLTGLVAGTVTKDGFDILLRGEFLQAKMTVVSSQCQQSVKVVPERADYMKELALVLRKC